MGDSCIAHFGIRMGYAPVYQGHGQNKHANFARLVTVETKMGDSCIAHFEFPAGYSFVSLICTRTLGLSLQGPSDRRKVHDIRKNTAAWHRCDARPLNV
jgi:hypothetical protein